MTDQVVYIFLGLGVGYRTTMVIFLAEQRLTVRYHAARNLAKSQENVCDRRKLYRSAKPFSFLSDRRCFRIRGTL